MSGNYGILSENLCINKKHSIFKLFITHPLRFQKLQFCMMKAVLWCTQLKQHLLCSMQFYFRQDSHSLTSVTSITRTSPLHCRGITNTWFQGEGGSYSLYMCVYLYVCMYICIYTCKPQKYWEVRRRLNTLIMPLLHWRICKAESQGNHSWWGMLPGKFHRNPYSYFVYLLTSTLELFIYS